MIKVLRGAGGLRLVPRAHLEAVDVAGALLARARSEAEAILQRAGQDASKLREEALAAAREEARVEGISRLAEASARASQRLTDAEAELVTLALEIARTVLGREASSGPEVLRDITRRALARVRQARRLVLRVNPEDLAWAERDARQWLPAGLVPEVLAFEADTDVARGGVRVDSELGRVDARIEAQLAALARGFGRR
jgi:flagellar biosynthesis/type III secretory pathway protein FliH